MGNSFYICPSVFPGRRVSIVGIPPQLILKLLNRSGYRQILFIFVLNMTAFIGKVILNIETGRLWRPGEGQRVTHARSVLMMSQPHGM